MKAYRKEAPPGSSSGTRGSFEEAGRRMSISCHSAARLAGHAGINGSSFFGSVRVSHALRLLVFSSNHLRETVMDHKTFQAWLAEADGLSSRQREEAARVLAEPVSMATVLALLKARIDEARRCPHCGTEGAVIRGHSNGLRPYCCKGCGKTFNALTGTPLAWLRKKELSAAFAEGLGEGDTVKGAAARCRVAATTSFRWRHRFLAALKAGSVKLKGIVEADETFVLASRKGARKLDRKARKRDGVAKKKSAAFQGSRCRSWWLPTAAARPSARCCPTAPPPPSGPTSGPPSSRMRGSLPTAPRSFRPAPDP